MMETCSLFSILALFSVEDVRRRTIPVGGIVVAAIVGLVMHLCFRRIGIWNVCGGILIGGILLLVSMASHERIGRGDALLLAVTGIFLGFWDNLMLFWIATVISAFCGLAAMLFFGKKKQDELPFVPCLLGSYLACLAFWGGRLA